MRASARQEPGLPVPGRFLRIRGGGPLAQVGTPAVQRPSDWRVATTEEIYLSREEFIDGASS